MVFFLICIFRVYLSKRTGIRNISLGVGLSSFKPGCGKQSIFANKLAQALALALALTLTLTRTGGKEYERIDEFIMEKSFALFSVGRYLR